MFPHEISVKFRLVLIIFLVVLVAITNLDLLSIPLTQGGNIKTFRWDHNRLQRKHLFMAWAVQTRRCGLVGVQG